MFLPIQTLTFFKIYQDATFEFERKRNRPERYDRNVTEQTLKAIPVIIKTRHDRLKKHIDNRLVLLLKFVVYSFLTRFSCLICNKSFNRHKPGKLMEMKKDSKELEQDINILPKKLVSNVVAAEKTKIKVKVVQQQTENNAMEE